MVTICRHADLVLKAKACRFGTLCLRALQHVTWLDLSNCKVIGIERHPRLDYQPLFGKMSPHSSPKERLDACDFLCWFKPIMSPPADFRLAKWLSQKQKVLPWSISWRGDFDGPETLGEILESEGTQRFVRLFVVNFSFNDCCWRDFASSRIFSRRFRSR